MQFFEKEGKRYSHIIDPATGKSSGEKMSVTVIARKGMDADALATALFVMKEKKGLALIEKMEGVEAMLIRADREVVYSSGFRSHLGNE